MSEHRLGTEGTLTKNIIDIIREHLEGGCRPVVQPIDLSTAGAIVEAKLRAEFFGSYAIFWMDAAVHFNSPRGEEIAAADARLAYRYAKIAYELEHERFVDVAETESVSTSPSVDTPG